MGGGLWFVYRGTRGTNCTRSRDQVVVRRRLRTLSASKRQQVAPVDVNSQRSLHRHRICKPYIIHIMLTATVTLYTCTIYDTYKTYDIIVTAKASRNSCCAIPIWPPKNVFQKISHRPRRIPLTKQWRFYGGGSRGSGPPPPPPGPC